MCVIPINSGPEKTSLFSSSAQSAQSLDMCKSPAVAQESGGWPCYSSERPPLS